MTDVRKQLIYCLENDYRSEWSFWQCMEPTNNHDLVLLIFRLIIRNNELRLKILDLLKGEIH